MSLIRDLKLPRLVRSIHLDGDTQVAASDALRGLDDLRDRQGDAARDEERDEDASR